MPGFSSLIKCNCRAPQLRPRIDAEELELLAPVAESRPRLPVMRLDHA
jgi:hypothetical protein